MIVKNPTDNDIQVQIMGTQYTVKANDELAGVRPEHAAYWIERLHTFIEIEEERPAAPAQARVANVVPPTVEPAAPVVPVVTADPVEPAPVVPPSSVSVSPTATTRPATKPVAPAVAKTVAANKK